MPILLQSLCESRQSTASGQNKDKTHYKDIQSVGELAKFVSSKVIVPIIKNSNPDEYKTGVHDPVMTDGQSYFEMSGKLYIYTGWFSPRWRPRILGGVDYVLKQLGVQMGTWTLEGKDANQRVIIPILQVNNIRNSQQS